MEIEGSNDGNTWKSLDHPFLREDLGNRRGKESSGVVAHKCSKFRDEFFLFIRMRKKIIRPNNEVALGLFNIEFFGTLKG
jgi:hypothetical protein